MKIFSRKDRFFALFTPAIIWQFFFFLIPAGMLFSISFINKINLKNLTFDLSILNYTKILNWDYLIPIFNSLFLCFLTSIICLLICVPISLFIHFRIPEKWQAILLLLLIAPSWTNFIIRIYAWFFLLQSGNFFSNFLFNLGIIKNKGALLSNFATVVLGMVYCYFPFMLVPIFSAVNRIDKAIVEAARDLGSSKIQTLTNIILPLIAESCYTGFLIVALSAFGEFAIQDFLGGAKSTYWGNLIVNKFLILCDYGSGAAIIFTGLFCLAIFILISFLIFHLFSKLLKKLFWQNISELKND